MLYSMSTKEQITITENFITILDAVPAIVFWQDLSGIYLGCNKHIANMTGVSGQDMLGKTDKDLAWGEASGQLQALDNLVINTKIKHEVEIKGINGHTYLLVKAPMYDNAGKHLIGMIGTATNASEYDDDKKIVHALKILSGGIAHDMRTPISAININIENLQHELKKLPTSDIINKFVDNIRFAVSSCSKFIDMLTTKLHIILKEQDQYYKFIPNSIKHCINEALQEYNFFGSERECISWDDKTNQDFIYLGNNLLIKHIIFNLIKNSLRAFKESDQGLSDNKIFISLIISKEARNVACERHTKEFNCLIFKDTATGIYGDTFENLFNKFNSDKDSTGLGLAFCKMVMQSIGGDIICDSKFGSYTKFTLKFPIFNKIG